MMIICVKFFNYLECRKFSKLNWFDLVFQLKMNIAQFLVKIEYCSTLQEGNMESKVEPLSPII